MAWPKKLVPTNHLLTAGGNPSAARRHLFAALQALRNILSARGQPGGACDLDDLGQVPGDRLGRGVAGGVCPLVWTGEDSRIPSKHLPRGEANGIATLGGGRWQNLIPRAQHPAGMVYDAAGLYEVTPRLLCQSNLTTSVKVIDIVPTANVVTNIAVKVRAFPGETRLGYHQGFGVQWIVTRDYVAPKVRRRTEYYDTGPAYNPDDDRGGGKG